MKLLFNKLQCISYVLTYLNTILTEESISFELISEAPKWLRLISRGNYCAYKNIIYVPSVHLELVSSPSDIDKTVATAKLLPWVMALHDNNINISKWKALQLLFSLPYQIHYNLYQFLFLKATNNQFYELITVGFMTTCRHFIIFKKIPYKQIEDWISAILEKNRPS